MKLAAPSAVLLSVLSTIYAQIYDPFIPTPECVKFRTIKFKGNAEFVDTDGSGIPAPQTTGK